MSVILVTYPANPAIRTSWCSTFCPPTSKVMSHQRWQVEPALGVLQRVLNVQIIMIRNIRVFNRTSIRLIAKGTVACTLVVDDVLDAIVVVLESSLVVENVTLELLEIIFGEGVHHGGNGGHRVLARAEAEAALRIGQIQALTKLQIIASLTSSCQRHPSILFLQMSSDISMRWATVPTWPLDCIKLATAQMSKWYTVSLPWRTAYLPESCKSYVSGVSLLKIVRVHLHR